MTGKYKFKNYQKLIEICSTSILHHLDTPKSYVPIIWFEETGTIDNENANTLRSSVLTLTYAKYSLLGASALGLIITVACFFIILSSSTKPKVGTKDY